MELRVCNAKINRSSLSFPRERKRIIPHNTCFELLGAFSAADVKILDGCGRMPPNVDLVIIEEATLGLGGGECIDVITSFS